MFEVDVKRRRKNEDDIRREQEREQNKSRKERRERAGRGSVSKHRKIAKFHSGRVEYNATQTPMWIKKKNRRKKDKIAKQTRKQNRS